MEWTDTNWHNKITWSKLACFWNISGCQCCVFNKSRAVSAAYLTRVVSSSLADFMAITKGVEEPDLDFIKKNSEKIVEKAFEKEKINWKGVISDLRKPLMKLSFNS